MELVDPYWLRAIMRNQRVQTLQRAGEIIDHREPPVNLHCDGIACIR